MKRTRTLAISAVAAAALAGGIAPSAHAAVWPTSWVPGAVDNNTTGGGPIRSGICGSSSGAENQGGTGGTNTYLCMGPGLMFVGPQIGQIASVVGPTIISPGFVGQVVTSAGNGAIPVG